MKNVQKYTSSHIKNKKEEKEMMNNLFGKYQTKIIAANGFVDYNNIIQGAYNPNVLANEQFIGIKVQVTDRYTCTDPYGQKMMLKPGDRIHMLEADMVQSKFLRGSGCIIRETPYTKPDGFWVITLPVPLSNLNTAMSNLHNVLVYLHNIHSIDVDGIYEINVSGRCRSREELEWRLQRMHMHMSNRLLQYLILPMNSVYRMGRITRINDEFIIFRSDWCLTKSSPKTIPEQFDDIIDISNAISSMYY